jgi:hypothetical protein
VIAATGPTDSLDAYTQAEGGTTWSLDEVAGTDTTYSFPSVAQIGGDTVIVLQGPDYNYMAYWQAMGNTTWNQELIAGPAKKPKGA